MPLKLNAATLGVMSSVIAVVVPEPLKVAVSVLPDRLPSPGTPLWTPSVQLAELLQVPAVPSQVPNPVKGGGADNFDGTARIRQKISAGEQAALVEGMRERAR